jgi:hypothetical protein
MSDGMRWLNEAVTARNRYQWGKPYKDYPEPGSKGWCARAARVLFREVTGQALPFAQKDADTDGDVDALDMMALEAAAGCLKPYQTTVPLKEGYRLYKTAGKNGHVGTVIGTAPVKIFENTSSPRGGKGPGTCIVTLAEFGRPQFVGTWLGASDKGDKHE